MFAGSGGSPVSNISLCRPLDSSWWCNMSENLLIFEGLGYRVDCRSCPSHPAAMTENAEPAELGDAGDLDDVQHMRAPEASCVCVDLFAYCSAVQPELSSSYTH